MTDYNSTQIYDDTVIPPALINQTTLAAIAASGGSTGSLVLLSVVTAAASATVDFPNFLTATYDNYFVTIENARSTTDAVQFAMRVGTTATPVYAVTGYIGTIGEMSPSAFAAIGGSTIQVNLVNGNVFPNAAARACGGYVYIFGVNTAVDKGIISNVGYRKDVAADPTNAFSDYFWTTGTVLTSLRFFCNVGNTSGTFRLYGIKNS